MTPLGLRVAAVVSVACAVALLVLRDWAAACWALATASTLLCWAQERAVLDKLVEAVNRAAEQSS